MTNKDIFTVKKSLEEVLNKHFDNKYDTNWRITCFNIVSDVIDKLLNIEE